MGTKDEGDIPLLRRGQKGWFAIAGTGSVEPALVALAFAKV